MRWTEIEEYAAVRGVPLPTYRQMDIWTRGGLLTAKFEGDRHGRFRDWSDTERDVALLVARLASVGFAVDLAFQIARTQPDANSQRRLFLDGGDKPLITVLVDEA